MDIKSKPRYNYFGMTKDRPTKHLETHEISFIGSFKTRNNSKNLISDHIEKTGVGRDRSIDMRYIKVAPGSTQNKDKVEEFLKTNFNKLYETKLKNLSKPRVDRGGTSFTTYLKHSKNDTTCDLNRTTHHRQPRPLTSDKIQPLKHSKYCSLNTSFIGSSPNKGSHNNSYFFKSEEEVTERTQDKIKVNIFNHSKFVRWLKIWHRRIKNLSTWKLKIFVKRY
jgi:hypothetical protein